MKNELLKNFNFLIKHLNLALSVIKNDPNKIINELIHWNSKITIDELKNNLSLILEKVTSWKKIYVKTNDIYNIDLKEYDLVSKESSYLIGECSLIDELYIEGIDFTIASIGALIINSRN